ncbi:hypothetical protein BX666DRAFT_1850776 [Dichotomocladium elegans]|nr:hypothetical protein BX666DRAFT_1850776 [Dichotomocladium elegans]
MNVTEDVSQSGPDTLEIISEALSLACITILALALGAKSKGQRLSALTYGRALVLFLYILSWMFCVMSIVTVSTNNRNTHRSKGRIDNIVSCTLGILICDVFYAGTKITIYAWLIERVHLATAVRLGRWQTTQYRIHMGMLCPYIGIFILMLIYRNNYILEDGTCIIGLQPISSIPLMCYDFLLNLYLTFLFVRPLINASRNPVNSSDWKGSRLYRLTRRTVVSSAVCLTVSLVNILILAVSSGRERGLVCLTMCTVDVTINVITIHWV